MNKTLRYTAVSAALVVWTCLATTWQLTAVLSALLYIAALWLGLQAMAANGPTLAWALFWLFFGGTYVSSAVEAYAFGLRSVDQAVMMLVTGAIVSFVVAWGLVWATGRREHRGAETSFVAWRWGPAILSAVAFTVLYLFAGALVFPKVRDFYATGPIQIPPLPVILALQLCRGLLWVAILFPCLRRIEQPRRAMLVLAIVTPVLGGIAPLIAPNSILPSSIRFWHTLEMTGSHASFGLFTAWAFHRRLHPKSVESISVRGTLTSPTHVELAESVTSITGDVEVVIRSRQIGRAARS